ncbi:MAG: glycosyltransferase family 4 protein [bacterium]
MRVLFVNIRMGSYRGGGEQFDLNLAGALARKGIEAEILTARPLTGRPTLKTELLVRFIPSPNVRPLLTRLGVAASGVPGAGRALGVFMATAEMSFFRACERLIEKMPEKPDVIQTNSFYALSLRWRSRKGWNVVARFPGPPPVKSRDDVLDCSAIADDGDAYRVIVRDFTPRCNHILRGIDHSLFRPRERGEALEELRGAGAVPPCGNGRYILYTGRMTPIKNLPLMLEGFARVAGDHPGVDLVLAGDGPIRARLEAKARSLGFKDRIHFMGEVPQENLPALYSAAEAFVLTSDYEMCSNSVLEAMASGAPAAATATGYTPEMIKEGETGLLVEPRSVESLAARLNEILSSPEKASALGARARRYVLETYPTWDVMADRFVRLYEKVLSDPGPLRMIAD